MLGFRSQHTAQRFLPSFGPICNTLYTQPHLTRRKTLRVMRYEAMREWREVTAAEPRRGGMPWLLRS